MGSRSKNTLRLCYGWCDIKCSRTTGSWLHHVRETQQMSANRSRVSTFGESFLGKARRGVVKDCGWSGHPKVTHTVGTPKGISLARTVKLVSLEQIHDQVLLPTMRRTEPRNRLSVRAADIITYRRIGDTMITAIMKQGLFADAEISKIRYHRRPVHSRRSYRARCSQEPLAGGLVLGRQEVGSGLEDFCGRSAEIAVHEDRISSKTDREEETR